MDMVREWTAAFVARGVAMAERDKRQLAAVITEAGQDDEKFLNSVGSRRLYFVNDNGQREELRYSCQLVVSVMIRIDL